MDQETRGEIEKLHARINDIKVRVVNLEAQTPHINAALLRIERSVDRLNGHISKAVWAVLLLFLGAVFKYAMDGGFSTLPQG